MFKRWKSSIAILEDNIFSDLDEPHPTAAVFESPSARFGLSIPVFHHIEGSLKKKPDGMSQNGLRLSLENPVPVGAEVALRVKFPDMAQVLDLKGVVIWKRPWFNAEKFSECGIAFENLRNMSNKEKIIRFMADRLCAMALRENYGLSARIARDHQDLLRAYHLIYREYAARGYCAINDAQMHYHLHSLMPESKIFMLEKGDFLAGTASLIIDSPAGVPMEKIFPDEIALLRKPGRKLAEVSLLAMDHQVFGKKSFTLTDFKKLVGTFDLFKILFDYARSQNVTDLLIAVHPKHKELYHYLTFNPFADVKSYEFAGGNPALPMHMDIQASVTDVDRQSSLYRFFIGRMAPDEHFELAWQWDSNSVQHFLYGYSQLWSKISRDEQQILAQAYPGIRAVSSTHKSKNAA